MPEKYKKAAEVPVSILAETTNWGSIQCLIKTKHELEIL